MVEVLLGYPVLFAVWQCGLLQLEDLSGSHEQTQHRRGQDKTGRDETGLGLSPTLPERLQCKERERAEEDGENPDRVQSQKGAWDVVSGGTASPPYAVGCLTLKVKFPPGGFLLFSSSPVLILPSPCPNPP